MPNFNEIKQPLIAEPKTIMLFDTPVQVTQYAPFDTKMALISEIINASGDDQGFYNSAKLGFYIDMKFMEYYTDLTFDADTDAMDVYDSLQLAGFFKDMYNAIPKSEFDFIYTNVTKTIDNIYKYRNSVYGILDALKTDYSDLDLDIEKLAQDLKDGSNVEFLKEVMDKMG